MQWAREDGALKRISNKIKAWKENVGEFTTQIHHYKTYIRSVTKIVLLTPTIAKLQSTNLRKLRVEEEQY